MNQISSALCEITDRLSLLAASILYFSMMCSYFINRVKAIILANKLTAVVRIYIYNKHTTEN